MWGTSASNGIDFLDSGLKGWNKNEVLGGCNLQLLKDGFWPISD